ncbi:hypothetical protein LCGC14_1032330 [marine sediment metagenome]|uniref:Uncharacterized protein n=1 Tax=marine sediment metagenome TaxID=412755 RepID=A0A0F9NFZ1_9ZZZZ
MINEDPEYDYYQLVGLWGDMLQQIEAYVDWFGIEFKDISLPSRPEKKIEMVEIKKSPPIPTGRG